MIGDVVGYCQLKTDVDCSFAMGEPSDWQGKPVRVLEFNPEGDVLCLDSSATKMSMFKKNDYSRHFKCKVVGDVICPPGLDLMGEMSYCGMAISREGGYNKLISKMVVAASLAKGEFDDSFLWRQKEARAQQDREKKDEWEFYQSLPRKKKKEYKVNGFFYFF